jgi:hypothetical protein
MASTAREIMSDNTECIGENDTVLDAAKKLAQLDVGAVPICGEDDRLKGMLTDRDIVVKVLAAGKDPASTKAVELGQGDGTVVTIGADDSIEETLKTMIEHKVRRIPVIDGSGWWGSSPRPTSRATSTRPRWATWWRPSPPSAGPSAAVGSRLPPPLDRRSLAPAMQCLLLVGSGDLAAEVVTALEPIEVAATAAAA